MSILLLKAFLIMQSGIYSLHFTDNAGADIAFSSFQGKKILIVNTAINSKYSSQFQSLEQLYQKYKDSLVVVAFPSNDFGNESNTDQAIQQYLADHYDFHFILAAKTRVAGQNISNLYKWLSSATENGVMDNPVFGDFTKFLIDGQGNIVGVFSGVIDPMSDNLQSAITQQAD